ncbi:hypothetical protein diail_8299 [Diaporthe ilicicola]|nr:hypothetical protein diail_8299 [Diaporthe ilicicola]
MAQLELFHHVCRQQLPLPLASNDDKILSGVLEAACSSPCLMNALLAVAALHLSHIRPAQSAYYHHQAVHFHTHALSIFNQERPQVTPDNCLSLIIFSQLTSLQVLYETTLGWDDNDNDNTFEPLNRFLEYIKVYRGVVLIAKEAWQALLRSKLGSIFTASAGIADYRTSAGAQTTELRSVISISRALDREQKQLCLEAVDRLQWILSPSDQDSHAEHGPENQEARGFHSLALVHAWPCLAHEAVLDLLCNKTPEALLMLAYYGVLMHQHRHFWTYANVGHVLVRTIARYLGPDWQHFMIWPLAQVFGLAHVYVPPTAFAATPDRPLDLCNLKMGQALSGHNDGPGTRTREELKRELADKFATKCFTSIELYSLKDNFKSLADVQRDSGGTPHLYVSETTIARFLELPDVLGVSPVVGKMVSFIGAFPFLQDAPAIMGLEALVNTVIILTERYQRVLLKGSTDRRRLLFRSLAVYDRKLLQSHDGNGGADDSGATPSPHEPGREVAGEGEPENVEDEDDGLVVSTFELLNCIDAYEDASLPTTQEALIPADNFRKLIMLLLLVAPMDSREKLSQYAERTTGAELEGLRSAAESILAAFLNVEKSPGIRSGAFDLVLPVALPFLFKGFNALFERFLFSKNLDFDRQQKDGDKAHGASLHVAAPLLQEKASIMNATIISQLSFFIPGSSLFRRLRLLYSGENDGFSMGSFETKVFNWRAPTILLVRGTRLTGSSGRSEERFAASLPPKRFPDGSQSSRLTYGVYVSQPWRHSHKECFGDSEALLFQLEPIHDVFPASSLNTDYVSFIRPGVGSTNTGIAAGNPLPTSSSYRKQSATHLGSVALLIDSSFEFGVFTHDDSSRGGAFQNSVSRKFDFQDRFEIDSLEVWGCGGDEEAKVQAERWAFEAREAEARRRINLGTGDIEADRALLEMAGLIGGNRSGGSMT